MTPRNDNHDGWRDAVYELAGFERPSASSGERRAAEWIAKRLRALGCRVEIEQERAHGGYWWPLGLANMLAGAGALLSRGGCNVRARRLGAATAALAAAAIWDDVGGGRLWFRRALLPHRSTWNVVAETGDLDAERTVVLLAHHDAAHSGLVFHPALPQITPRLLPQLHERSNQGVPILYGVWLGPALICLGLLLDVSRLIRLGLAFAVGATAVMVDIGVRRSVPGANDNLSSVGALVALAQALRDRPLDGVRVMLVSTGSEESFMEGMQAFGRRHFDELDPRRTEILCLECLGGPTLVVLEGEGMLRMRKYTAHMREALVEAAAETAVPISRGLKSTAATDALVALRAGYPVATLASVDHTKYPLNYHWPSDTPAALHWQTIEDAIAVCERFLRLRARPAE